MKRIKKMWAIEARPDTERWLLGIGWFGFPSVVTQPHLLGQRTALFETRRFAQAAVANDVARKRYHLRVVRVTQTLAWDAP